jgi:hypothetical protein
VDGQIGTGGSFGAVLSNGTHTITAAVTDSGSQSCDAFITIEVQPASGVTVTVASLTGSSTTINKNFWKATVTATIDPALAVTVVSGVWEGDDKAANCTTDDLG